MRLITLNSMAGKREGCGARSASRAFTMAEILVVILIILIVATLSLPAFNVITGTKSVESATNVLTSVLSRARSEAMARQQPIGLAVYFDQAQQKTALAVVGYAQAWTNGVAYQRGDMVYSTTGGARKYWLCNAAHIANSANAGNSSASDAPPYAASAGSTTLVQGVSWTPFPTGSPVPQYASSQYVSILPETEVNYLPPGIAAQVLNASRIVSSTGSGAASTDRYLHQGVVFFDADGKLAPQQQWGVLFDPGDLPGVTPANAATNFRSSRLGLAIRFNYVSSTNATLISSYQHYTLDPIYNSTTTPNCSALLGGMGVVLYDRQTYDTQGFPTWDYQTTNQAYSTGPGSDGAGETWLDNNGTLVLLNRFTGTILKTE